MGLLDRFRPATPPPLVMTLQEVIDGAATVTLVVHEDDESAGWQYLVSGPWSDDSLRLVHRGHLFRADPTLEELNTLPKGKFAARDDAAGSWHYGDITALPAHPHGLAP